MVARLAPVTITAAAAGTDGQPARRTFRIAAYTGEAMSICPWDAPVVVDLASVDLSVQQIPVLYDHCPWIENIVGQGQALSVVNGELIVEGTFTVDANLPPERNVGAQVLARADAGYQWQASIGGDPGSVDEVKAGESISVNGRTYPGPCYVARGVKLREVSFVVLGGDGRTRAVVARNGMEAAMSFEEWLLSMGFADATQLDDVQRANLQMMYNDEMAEGDIPDDSQTPTDPNTPPEAGAGSDPNTPPAADNANPPTNAAARRPRVSARTADAAVIARRRQEAAETARVNEIRRICAAANNPTMTTGAGQSQQTLDIAAHAIEQGWPVNEVRREIELQQLRSERRPGPNVITRDRDRDMTVQALQGAMILRARGRLDHPAYQTPQALNLRIPAWLRAGLNDAERNRLMEAAHRYSDMSLVDVCREALRIDGRDAPFNRQEMIQAAFSGSALTNIFTTNVNAMLLSSYVESADTTVGWVNEVDVNDFKTQERPRVEMGPGLTLLPRGGEADHSNYADVAETYKISRFARQFVIDEMDIVDDSLGALSDIPQKFGMAAARLRPDLVYAILLANPTLAATTRALFNTTDGNQVTTSALTAATLRTAVKTMMLFTENSVNIDIQPTDILVPPTLRHLAGELINSSEILIAAAGTTDASLERGRSNSLREDNLSRITEKRLENGVTDPSTGTAYSGSSSTWYLISRYWPIIEVGYLRGTGRAPQIRSGQLDKGQFGLWFDVKHDIGAKAIDWRGAVQLTA